MERFSKYESLFENFITGVVFHDPSTKVLFANTAALNLLGLTMDQMLGKSVTDPHWRFIREDGSDMPLSEFPVSQALQHRKAIKNLVLGIIRKELEKPIWVICNGHLEFDHLGNIELIIINFSDITEQKRAEEKLSKQLVLTKGLTDSMLDGVSVLDKDGTQLDVNPAFCQMTGFHREEIIGMKPPFAYWPPEEYSNILSAFQKTIAQGYGNFELVFMRKNGERFPVIVTPSNIKDNNDNIVMYVASVKDITSIKKTERELKETAQQLSKTYALAHIGVWHWIISSDKVIWSDEMKRIAGIPSHQEPPSFAEMSKMHTPESWERLRSAVAVALATGDPYQIELEYVLSDGGSRIVNAYGGAKRDLKGKIVELYGTVQDITDKKQAESKLKTALEAAEKAVNMKSRFLDIAAHELRTPVSAFSLLLQFTQKKFTKGIPVDLQTLNRLKTQVDRISQLVVELLDVSRLERGVLVLKPARTNIVAMVQHCIEDFKLREHERRIDFKSPAEHFELNIDGLRIFQVLSNLIDNAIKYTPEGSPIEVSIEKLPQAIRIKIKDQGDGIPEKDQKILFDPFSRGSTESADKAGGLGLGLYISREIVLLHGGTIGVESKPGSGSTFYFELPAGGT